MVQLEFEPHTPYPESAMLTPNYKLSENAGKNEEFQKKQKNTELELLKSTLKPFWVMNL